MINILKWVIAETESCFLFNFTVPQPSNVSYILVFQEQFFPALTSHVSSVSDLGNSMSRKLAEDNKYTISVFLLV